MDNTRDFYSLDLGSIPSEPAILKGDDKVFSLTEDQLERLRRWMKAREEWPCGTIGDRYTYSFTPTGLGTIIIVTDHTTKEEINLTDFDSW